ncbi:MAG: class I SAM-dependent methyltransferase [Acidobacteria bacterium]|nr:class I SAM-dependent methyltransferase [Acidobacteriota bacterium]
MALDERPEVTAQRNFREHREALASLDLRRRFEYIRRHNLWGCDESVSGVGSTMAETASLRAGIPPLLAETGARSLLDIPCGDFGWLSTVELGVPYTGADIVEALVEANRQRYARDDRRFLRLDLTADALPAADLVLCRDCLVHLSYANIERALANIRASGARWLLTTTFLRQQENREIEDGDWRPLNFELPPFSFAPPERVLIESCVEAGGAYDDKALGLWRVTRP